MTRRVARRCPRRRRRNASWPASLIPTMPSLALNTALLRDGAVVRWPRVLSPARPLEIVHRQRGWSGLQSSAPRRASRSAPTQRRSSRATARADGRRLPDEHRHRARSRRRRQSVVGTAAGGGRPGHPPRTARHAPRRDATLRPSLVNAGAALWRGRASLPSPGGGARRLHGATMLSGRQHIDTTLVVDHAVPHCKSRELFKGVMDGEARGVFQGKIIVRPDAQKTDAKMMARRCCCRRTPSSTPSPSSRSSPTTWCAATAPPCGQIDEDHAVLPACARHPAARPAPAANVRRRGPRASRRAIATARRHRRAWLAAGM